MESPAPASTAQGEEQRQQDNTPSTQANSQQPNTEAQLSEPGQQTTVAAATAQASTSIPAPDLNALPQGDLANLSLQGLPTDFSLMPMLGPDGNILTEHDLMNMPLMMPMMMDGSAMMDLPVAQTHNITKDEIALYDRQIRLWGMQAQQKIRNASVLLITMKGLGNEIAKNLVLAGIGTLTILDHENVTEADLGAQFLVSQAEGHVGTNRAQAALASLQELNPRVTIIVNTEDVRRKGATYFTMFDMIIATDLDPDALNVINTATRVNLRPFYAAGTHGLYGFIFADLIEHQFTVKRQKSNVATEQKPETRTRIILDVQDAEKENGRSMESVLKKELYSTWFLASLALLPAEFTKSKRRLKAVSPALSCLRALWEFQTENGGRTPANKNDIGTFTSLAMQKHKELGLPAETVNSEFLRSFLQNVGCEIAPVTAILGGQLAQDVINVLGGTQQPIQNTLIFDGNTMEGSLYPLHPQGPLGAVQLNSAPLPGGLNGFDLSDPSLMNMPMGGMDLNMGGVGNMGLPLHAANLGASNSVDMGGMGAMGGGSANHAGPSGSTGNGNTHPSG